MDIGPFGGCGYSVSSEALSKADPNKESLPSLVQVYSLGRLI